MKSDVEDPVFRRHPKSKVWKSADKKIFCRGILMKLNNVIEERLMKTELETILWFHFFY